MQPAFLSRLCLGFIVFSLAGVTVRADDKAPVTAGVTITVPASTGKFDFLEVDAPRHRLLAAHEKDETADFFDLDHGTLLARVKVGPAVDVIVDPKTGNYLVSVQDDKRIAILDGATFKETGSIALPGESDAIRLEPKSRQLYVTHDNGSHVWVVNVDTAKLVATIAIPGEPECMALDAATGRIFLNIKSANEVVVIDTRRNALVATWPTAPATAPHGLVFDAGNSRLYSAGDNGVLAILDSDSGKVVGSARITTHVDQAAFDPVTRMIYCAGPDEMSVLQATADGATSLGNVKTAATAKNVAVDPATHAVWTTYTDGTNSYAQSFERR